MQHYPQIHRVDGPTFTTLGEAVQALILDPLGDEAKNFDIESIAHLVIGSATMGSEHFYFQRVTKDGFWKIVEMNTAE